MRPVIRTIIWAAIGALPGLIMFAVPGFVESQSENLALALGGFVLATVGAVIGGVAGSSEDAKTRRRVAGVTTSVAVVSVVLFVATARYYRNVIIGGVIAAVPIVVATSLSRRTKARPHGAE